VINDTISCRSMGAVAKFTPSDETGSYQPYFDCESGALSEYFYARVAELVDALDLGSSGATRESSSLSFRTKFKCFYHEDIPCRCLLSRAQV
jgi:hypothetical protein